MEMRNDSDQKEGSLIQHSTILNLLYKLSHHFNFLKWQSEKIKKSLPLTSTKRNTAHTWT
jgi:hypothetical protein